MNHDESDHDEQHQRRIKEVDHELVVMNKAAVRLRELPKPKDVSDERA